MFERKYNNNHEIEAIALNPWILQMKSLKEPIHMNTNEVKHFICRVETYHGRIMYITMTRMLPGMGAYEMLQGMGGYD